MPNYGYFFIAYIAVGITLNFIGPLARQLRLELFKLSYDSKITSIKKLLFMAVISLGIALLYPAFLFSALLGKRKERLLSNAGQSYQPAPELSGVIQNCDFEFQCPLSWDSLSPTSKPSERFCGSCSRTVHFCNTQLELDSASLKGLCVAIKAPSEYNTLTTPLTVGAIPRQKIKLPTLIGVRRMPYEGSKKGHSAKVLSSRPD